MGIKDNFSQAVKELWKKDGMEENPEESLQPAPGTPTQLDQYLNQQDDMASAAPVAPAAPVQQATPVQQAAPVQQPAPAAPVQQSAPQQAPVQQPAPAVNAAGVPLETPYYRDPAQQTAPQQPQQNMQSAQNIPPQGMQGAPVQQTAPAQNGGFGGYGAEQNYNTNNGFGGSYAPPASGNVNANRAAGVTDEVTVISKNTIIDGNVRSLANMQVDGNIKGNVETTRDIDMTGKVVGDINCNNANMNSAAMQGNLTIKGKMRMDRDTILIGDLTSNYADVNGRIRGKLEIAGKAELKRDAIVFGDINASTIAVTDGAIIQGYVNTTFLSKEDSRNAFPEAISLDAGKDAGVK